MKELSMQQCRYKTRVLASLFSSPFYDEGRRKKEEGKTSGTGKHLYAVNSYPNYFLALL
jgi:hypothetical protein